MKLPEAIYAGSSDRSARTLAEKASWSKVFEAEIAQAAGADWRKFSSYWWEDYYEELTKVAANLLLGATDPAVLELGSGSGKATLLLPASWPKTLLDISPTALSYAGILARKLSVPMPECIEGDAFAPTLPGGHYSLVWNIGMLEHYEAPDIVDLLTVMIRLCAPGGVVAFGVPRAFSGPMLKARLLTKWPFRKLPGYRVDTEIWYSRKRLIAMLEQAARASNVELRSINGASIGSPLPMEMPAAMLRCFRPLASIFPAMKFLNLVSATVIK